MESVHCCRRDKKSTSSFRQLLKIWIIQIFSFVRALNRKCSMSVSVIHLSASRWGCCWLNWWFRVSERKRMTLNSNTLKAEQLKSGANFIPTAQNLSQRFLQSVQHTTFSPLTEFCRIWFNYIQICILFLIHYCCLQLCTLSHLYLLCVYSHVLQRLSHTFE